MKAIIILLLISSAATAQSDTARQPIRLQFMQQHIAFMGAELQQRNSLSDHRIYDTLKARIGSGTKPDSVTTATYTAGFVVKFFEKVVDWQGGSSYFFLDVLISGKSGYTGLQAQLNSKVQANGNEGKTARWLRAQIQDILKRKADPFNEMLKAGADYLKNPIEYN